MTKRLIVLDTETTGLNRRRDGSLICEGHRVVEIACVEIIGTSITGNYFHTYIQPGVMVDPKAVEIHGLTDDFLKDKPTFQDVCRDFLSFIRGAILIIHNAPFDIKFIDQEFSLLPLRLQPVGVVFNFIDTLSMARDYFPFVKNDLGSLCTRFGVKGREKKEHGALEDARLLACIYLKLTNNVPLG